MVNVGVEGAFDVGYFASGCFVEGCRSTIRTSDAYSLLNVRDCNSLHKYFNPVVTWKIELTRFPIVAINIHFNFVSF